ncbi:MAG: Uma2 family endonuclease, partial [Thermoflexibacter sp.]|nr:Uma2 family endonuclease [Thermoflexibacter sp.]
MLTLDQLNPTQIYSYADYLTWQFSERIELLKGYARQMSAPNRFHQTLSINLAREIAYAFKGHECRV